MAEITQKDTRELVSRALPFVPITPDECNAIRQELERILESPHFQNSKRYPRLLRYVVDQALRGNVDLKERTLGIEVFGRPATYDSNADPVVRVTAGEVRKRLAQYYHELKHQSEFQIELPPGAYVPEFRRIPSSLPDVASKKSLTPSVPETTAPELVRPRANEPIRNNRRKRVYAVALVILLVGLGWLALRMASTKPGIVEVFWGPVVHSPGTALLCIGDLDTFRQQYPALFQASVDPTASSDPTVSSYINTHEHLFVSDVITMMKAASVLQSLGKDYRVVNSAAADLATLRQGPVVLVGGHNNRWTLRLTEGLRFYPTLDLKTGVGAILDRQDPTRREWDVPLSTVYTKFSQDFAIVARVKDPTTGRPVIIAAGLAAQGTLAAGEFISTPEQLNSLVKGAPPNWQDMNMEAVIATQVIDGKTGPPRVVAIYFW